MTQTSLPVAYTFDDVSLVPQSSDILPKDVDLATQLTRRINLQIPFCSAAMDTVTEAEMAITMALHGGIGVIHKNCSPEEQAEMVLKVKRFENGFIRNPQILSPQQTIQDVIKVREECGFKTVPITADGTLRGKVVGMIQRTNYLSTRHAHLTIAERMTPVSKLLKIKGPITLRQANDVLEESTHSKLLILNKDDTLWALLTRKDLEKNEEFPQAAKDEEKKLLVAAAVSPGPTLQNRIKAIVQVGVDVIVVDTAHGHSAGVIKAIKWIKKNYPSIDVIGGNIATAEAAKTLIEAGADAVKVGIGPGSICTTRVVTGVGVPQFSAIQEVAKVAKANKVPVIADGGIKYSGDAAKALAAGASTVMIGSLLAGTDNAPGEMLYANGKTYKYYRGMGSISAMQRGSKDRYAQADSGNDKLVPEGIEGRILYRGTTGGEIFQLCGGLRSAFGYCGSVDIVTLQKQAKFVRITSSGLREAHPHDISVIQEAPNYRGAS